MAVPAIVRHGVDWWKGLSVIDEGGTKIFGVAGRVANPGCFELPMGVPMRELIEVHAGGMLPGYALRAVSPGGASTCVRPRRRDRRAPRLRHDGRGPEPPRHRHAGAARRPDLPRRHDAQHDAVLRPGVVRLVHAVPRGAAVGGRAARGHRVRARPSPGTSRCSPRASGSCSRTSASATSRRARRSRSRARCACSATTSRATSTAAAATTGATARTRRRSRGRRGERRPRSSPAQARHRHHRRRRVPGRRGPQHARRRPLPGLRPAVLLLAPGAGVHRRLPPVRRAPVLDRPRGQGEERDRHGLHDGGAGRHEDGHLRRRGGPLPRRDDRAHDAQPPARLPGLRRGRRVPPAGHDGDDRAQLPALPRPQADLREPGPRAVRHPRAQPLHHLLPLHALLQRLRRRPRLRRVRPAQPGVLRPRRERHAGERVQRQPHRGLPDRRVRRQAVLAPLLAQVGPADGAVGVPGLRPRLHDDAVGALRRAAPRAGPLQPRRQQDVPLRPRPLRLRVRQRAAAGARRAWPGCCRRRRSRRAPAAAPGSSRAAPSAERRRGGARSAAADRAGAE